jgi:hypothetical protein
VSGLLVNLENAKYIMIGVQEVSLPASTGHCEFGHSDPSSLMHDQICRLIEIFNLD